MITHLHSSYTLQAIFGSALGIVLACESMFTAIDLDGSTYTEMTQCSLRYALMRYRTASYLCS